MSAQITVRLPDELATQLDVLMEQGGYATRADVVRRAITTLAEAEGRGRVGAAIADGYRRRPQTDAEVSYATRAAIASIEEEPW